ncbi:ABC transporter ATP-binding protein [Pseudomonas aeruginosa]
MQASPAIAAVPAGAGEDAAVVIEGVDKNFGDVKALRGLSARIHYGRLTGLVGPDGAGKTTLMRILTGLLVPNAGHVTLAGYDVVKDNDAIHVASGYMPQRFGLYEDLSVMENMRLYAQLRGMDADRNADLFAELLDFTRLGPFTKRLAGKLSGGMKQKLGLACALMARPKVLLLDEPGVGVDPVSRQDLWRMVQALTDEGMAVVWSTAYLDEAERCESVLLLNQGQLLFDGPPQELTAQLEGRSFRLEDVGAERRAVLTQALRPAQRERWRDPGRRRARGVARGRGRRAAPGPVRSGAGAAGAGACALRRRLHRSARWRPRRHVDAGRASAAG